LKNVRICSSVLKFVTLLYKIYLTISLKKSNMPWNSVIYTVKFRLIARLAYPIISNQLQPRYLMHYFMYIFFYLSVIYFFFTRECTQTTSIIPHIYRATRKYCVENDWIRRGFVFHRIACKGYGCSKAIHATTEVSAHWSHPSDRDPAILWSHSDSKFVV